MPSIHIYYQSFHPCLIFIPTVHSLMSIIYPYHLFIHPSIHIYHQSYPPCLLSIHLYHVSFHPYHPSISTIHVFHPTLIQLYYPSIHTAIQLFIYQKDGFFSSVFPKSTVRHPPAGSRQRSGACTGRRAADSESPPGRS